MSLLSGIASSMFLINEHHIDTYIARSYRYYSVGHMSLLLPTLEDV